MVAIEGNHDKRLRTALLLHLREAYGLRAADEIGQPAALTPERLLALGGLGIEWIGDYPDGELWINPGLKVVHGDVARAASGATARAIVDGSDVSVIFGHIHRREAASRTLYLKDGARAITARCSGCVCRVDGAVPGKRARQNWQQGFSVLDFDESGESVYDVPIVDGSAIWAGRRFVARDVVGALRDDLPDWEW